MGESIVYVYNVSPGRGERADFGQRAFTVPAVHMTLFAAGEQMELIRWATAWGNDRPQEQDGR